MVGNIGLTLNRYNALRGKFNRMCSKKPSSGKLEVPETIHESFLSKGDAKDNLWQLCPGRWQQGLAIAAVFMHLILTLGSVPKTPLAGPVHSARDVVQDFGKVQ